MEYLLTSQTSPTSTTTTEEYRIICSQVSYRIIALKNLPKIPWVSLLSLNLHVFVLQLTQNVYVTDLFLRISRNFKASLNFSNWQLLLLAQKQLRERFVQI